MRISRHPDLIPPLSASAGHANSSPPPWRVWSALAAVYLIWGSTYLAIRVMVRDIPPLLGAAVRYLIAGGLLLAVLAARDGARWARPRARRIRIGRRSLWSAALVGLLLPAGGNGIVTLAEKHVPSGLAALLVASVPLWVIVLRRGVARERIGRATLAGVGVGFCGAAVLLLPGSRPAGTSIAGMVLILIAAASWACGSFAAPRLRLPSDPLLSVGWQMLWGGAVLLVAGVAAGELGQVHVAHTALDSWLAIAYLITAGSIVAYTAYAWLLQHAPISQVATYAYVNPLVAVVLGWAILGESLATATAIGAALIVVSVGVTVTREARPRLRGPREPSGARDRPAALAPAARPVPAAQGRPGR
jgi:drug/metabolite transporter (DMT)-like permease